MCSLFLISCLVYPSFSSCLVTWLLVSRFQNMVLKERSVHALRELDQVNKFKRGRNSFSEVVCFQKKNLNMNDCDMNIQTLHECAFFLLRGFRSLIRIPSPFVQKKCHKP